jgi:prophage regulatory protein
MDSNAASLPSEGYVRISSIIKPHGVLNVSRSRWYSGIEKGEFPKPRKLGHVSLWPVTEIRALLARIGDSEQLDRAA